MNDRVNISARQKQILIGKLLGDGHLETANGKTYRLKIEHALSQKSYVDWLYQELQSLAASAPRVKRQVVRGKAYHKYWFNSRYSGSLRFYAQQFYPVRKKEVPRLIERWLTPLTVAIWFMDDGSIKSKECRGKLLNTQGFDEQSLRRLQQAFQRRYQIRTTLRPQREGKQIYIPAEEIEKFRKIVGPYLIPTMRYKLG